MNDLRSITWPIEKLDEALGSLARKSSVAPQMSSHQRTPPSPGPEVIAQYGGREIERYIESAASAHGIEAEPVETAYSEIDNLLSGAGPALLCVPVEGEPRFLAILGNVSASTVRKGASSSLSVLCPDLVTRRVSLQAVRAALCRSLEAPLIEETDRVLEEARVPPRRRERARAAILRERLSAARIRGCWLLRPSPGSSFWHQIRQAGLRGRFLTVAAAYTALYILWILSWWLIGRGALSGHTESGWMMAWALILFTLVPMRLFATWSQGVVAIRLGALLKQRLLYGALKLGPDEIRHQGAGQLLGRVFESEALENLAMTGGFLGLFALIELLLAIVILTLGASGAILAPMLALWSGFVLFMAWRYYRRRRHWTDARFSMTHDLIERMVGHRTRLAQEPPERWHEEEDRDLERYIEISRLMDRTGAALSALAPRGWLVVGLVGLTPAFVAGSNSPSELAISLGGIIFAFRALQKLAAGLSQIAGAAIASKAVAPFFRGASQDEDDTPAALSEGAGASASEEGQLLLDARDIVFRYRARTEPVLRGCNLQIRAGDRILLEGESGSGKSTLGALLTGLRLPESGVVLLGGLDRRTIGAEEWRRRVVLAPQFHENHVLTETFAFNLLMGRGWPPQAEDFEEAEALCRELGLGDLLDRMPAGLVQMVGESGWQLSHGERSRLYIARALLQGADVVVLDESFAALDPDNLSQALNCVLKRARTLILIAHP